MSTSTSESGTTDDPTTTTTSDTTTDTTGTPTTTGSGSSSSTGTNVCGDGVPQPGVVCMEDAFSIRQAAFCLATGDFDDSGNIGLGLVRADGTVRLSLYDGTTVLTFGTETDVTDATVNDCATGDFDDDGQDDFAVAVDGNIYVAYSDGLGDVASTQQLSVLEGGNALGVARGDFFDNARDDLVGVIVEWGISSYPNDQVAGTLGTRLNTIDPPDVARVVGGALDNGAGDDLVIASSSAAQVHVVTNSPAELGIFSAPSQIAVSDVPGGLVAADFDGDTALDVAVAIPAADVVDVLLGDGVGGFAAAVSYDAGDEPVDVTVGDFDGDGTVDLAVANATDRTVTVHLGDGAGGFEDPEVLDVSGVGTVGPTDVVAIDVNDDGVDELFTAGDEIAVITSDP